MNNPTYSQKIDHWLQKQSGCTLLDYCKHFGYYPLAVKIMGLDETNEKATKRAIAVDKELRDHYLTFAKDTWAQIAKGSGRSWTHYFKSLIAGWVIEDLFIEMLHKQCIDIQHNGCDAQRKILPGDNVQSRADFQIRVGEVSRKVELTSEFNSILKDEGFIEKRAPALVTLWKDKGIWIYRDIPRGKYVLVDFAVEKVKLHLRSHNTSENNWTKDVHRYILAENNKIERDDRLLAPEIISMVGCSIDDIEQPMLEEVEDIDSPPMKFSCGGILKDSLKSSKDKAKILEAKLDVIKKSTHKKEEKRTEDRSSIKVSPPPIPQPPPPTESLPYEEDESEEALCDNMDYGDSDFV